MQEASLNVIFLWHMHQPDYRDAEKKEAMMPWVRLHGIKDYLDMVTILDDFPKVRQNFNLVPSLLDQIQGYVDGSLTDRALILSRKKVDDLSVEDRTFLLQSFFHAHWDNMIKPYPRYWELLKLRGFHPATNSLNEVQRYFSEQDFLDLQVWYNLVWIDPSFRKEFRLLDDLIRRQRNFSENDKLAVLKLQKQIMARIIPAYRNREENNQIELSTTPYYHPILPLLYDTNLAQISQPHDSMPSLRFAHPEDVRTQINRAVQRHEYYFGRKPTGLWPSEGSVCQEIIPFIGQAGINWIATDEGILANSVGREPLRDHKEVVRDPASWYQAYKIEEQGTELKVIFRDHLLSDLIGFVYSHWNEQQAADDFIRRLGDIKKNMRGDVEGRAVAIILDGENAWEHFAADGALFLKELYGRLNDSPDFQATTIDSYLAGRKNKFPELKKIFPGSWINRNFRIWIGHQEDNLAWDYLGRARRTLVLYEHLHADRMKTDKELMLQINNAWEHIYIAEGSDWCWWYGDDHSSENDADFDELFRSHLKSVYRFIGEDVPDYLFRPIIMTDKALHPKTEISSFIKPEIDGEESSYYEWRAAAFYDAAQQGGAMHRSEYLAKGLYYGFNQSSFFLRVDIDRKSLTSEGYNVSLKLVNSRQETAEFNSCYLQDAGRLILVCEGRKKQPQQRVEENETELEGVEFAVNSVFEIRIPFVLLGVKIGEDLNFSVTLKHQGQDVQRIPSGGYLHLTAPDPDFEERMWYV
ncbi:MAG TPA: hypothetical protein ENN66_09825 [Proteobacteria bacterium]|nr:hypothetical protein [Pseudomonadota bacterium]